MPLHLGIDLIEIERLQKIAPEIRARFLQRVYTPAELQSACDSNEFLAGRFAAKEAAAKAFGTGIGPISWQEIEILSGENGEPLLSLHGKAAALAASKGYYDWTVSISHTRQNAVAVVACMS